MQIVIDITKLFYEYCKMQEQKDATEIQLAIKNGTPLPEGHGRIGDLDAVMDDICTSIDTMTNIGITVDGDYLWAKLNEAIYNTPTIVEADKKVKMKRYYVRYGGTVEVLSDSEDEDEIFEKAEELIRDKNVSDMDIIDVEDIEE